MYQQIAYEFTLSYRFLCTFFALFVLFSDRRHMLSVFLFD